MRRLILGAAAFAAFCFAEEPKPEPKKVGEVFTLRMENIELKYVAAFGELKRLEGQLAVYKTQYEAARKEACLSVNLRADCVIERGAAKPAPPKTEPKPDGKKTDGKK